MDLEDLRVAGGGGSAGGLYAREHVSGVVLVNSSNGSLGHVLDSPMKRARWSGGGPIDRDATPPPYTLEYDEDVPAGVVSVPARSVMVLRDPAGAPPPGEEDTSG